MHKIKGLIRMVFGLGKPDIKKMEREKDIKGLMRALKFNNDESIRREAAFAIGKITSPEVETPAPTLNHGISDLSHNTHNDDEEPTVEMLIHSLEDEDWDVRKNAAKALVKIGEPSVEMLIIALKDEKWRVRWHAAETLGETGDIQAVEPLINALNDENNGVRSNSTIALVNIGEPAVKKLINALKDKEWHIRSNAAETLGELGDTRAVEPLINALNDENSWVRQSAASALGNIGDTRAEEPLKKASNDEDNEVQKIATKALIRIRG